MPNHVTTRVQVSGSKSEVDRFIKIGVNRSGKDGQFFDFESFIPCPPALKIDAGTETDLGMHHILASASREFKMPVHFKDREVTPQSLMLGRQALINIALYGAPTWYEWSYANWGTKWNSYAFNEVKKEDGFYVFTIQTAWSFPEPVFHKVAAAFPSLRISIACFDEGWNFAGKGVWTGGNGTFAEVQADKEIYEEVYGHPPEDEEE